MRYKNYQNRQTVPKKPHTQLEACEQATLMEWAELQKCKYPELAFLFHVPNGGSRHPIEAANLKRQGVKSGVPDLVLPVARGGYHGMFIEMKAGKNKVSSNQALWIAFLLQQGNQVKVCYGWEQAAEEIIKYLEVKK